MVVLTRQASAAGSPPPERRSAAPLAAVTRCGRAFVLRCAIAAAALGGTAALLPAADTVAVRSLDGIDRKKLYGEALAQYLIGFGLNVRWPDSAFATDDAPWRIGILGQDPFGTALDQLVAGKKLKGRPITIVRSDDPAALAGCHIVFLDQPAPELVAQFVAQVATRPVLTVVFSLDRTAKGGALELFVTKEGVVRYLLNVAALRAAGLAPSPELLQLALAKPPR